MVIQKSIYIKLMQTLPELTKAMDDYEKIKLRKPSTDLKNQNISVFSNPSSFSILNKTKYLFVSNRVQNNEDQPIKGSENEHPNEEIKEDRLKQQQSDKPEEQEVKRQENQEENESQHKQAIQEEKNKQSVVLENSRVKIDVPNLKLTESKVQNKSWQSPPRYEKIDKSHHNDSKQKIRQSMVLSKVERQSIRKNIEEITKQIKQKVKEWSKQQKQIQRRKQLNQQKQKIKIYEIQLEKEREKLERKRKQKEEKKLKIVQRINEMQENRMKREIYLKKNSPKIDQKKSLPHLQNEEINRKRYSHKDIRPDFKVNFKTKEEVIQEEQKLQRRKNFNNKVRSIPVNINEEKRIQLEIDKDKSKNSLKYQLLNRRGFSDFQIYERSKKFSLPKSSKEIGDKYLEQIRMKNKGKNLQIANSRSVEKIWSIEDKHIQQNKPKQQKKHILYNNDLDVLLYYKAKKRQHEKKVQ